MLNREVFATDPTTTPLPNDGVATVGRPDTPEQWEVLRYELRSFVCDGEYERGLERILSGYLGHLGQPYQPAVWVSGFYGSGKSHFLKVLEYLWRDYQFPNDGATARSLAQLPPDIRAHLTELSTRGRQQGGLWSAAGQLGAGAGTSIRLALLGVLFESAGLPTSYPPARFLMWLRKEKLEQQVQKALANRGRSFEGELPNMYVSPALAEALIEAIPGFAATPAEARGLLKAQYPIVQDISQDELEQTMTDVLALVSSSPGKMPLTLIVLDEMQQFIGQDTTRTIHVQGIVEACSARFGSRLLFVAAGQSAIQATTELEKLQGRFTVRVELQDTDVEKVVREVVLRKAADKVAPLQTELTKVSGEIDRHLLGTRIGATAADKDALVPDYPLLPVRRRFWERVLRQIDVGGQAGQLRTQLHTVHRAARAVAELPIGHVIPGDAIYQQQKAGMLSSGVLMRDLSTRIDELNDETEEGRLKSRLCSLIFLIGQFPSEGPQAAGAKGMPDTLADLLVEDLTSSSVPLRQRVADALKSLENSGMLMLANGEYRLQTKESQDWEQEYRLHFARVKADDARVADKRTERLREALDKLVRGIGLVQGESKVPRKARLHFGFQSPMGEGVDVPVWVRDEWSVTERTVKTDAQEAGVNSSLVYVFLPKRDADALKDALAAAESAGETITGRPVPTTTEGQEARRSMESRRDAKSAEAAGFIDDIIEHAKVFQGGGNEIAEGSIQASLRTAVEASLARLFPDFAVADHARWGLVFTRASEGNADALSAVGYQGAIDQHPVCSRVLAYAGAGKKGSDIRKHFSGKGFGWGQDAIDGALLALVGSSLLRASRNGQPVGLKEIGHAQIPPIDFRTEAIPLTQLQRLAVQSLCNIAGVPCQKNREPDAAPALVARLVEVQRQAGGEPPLPQPVILPLLEHIRELGGNEQVAELAAARNELETAYKSWTELRDKADQRTPVWERSRRLLQHAAPLSVAAALGPQLTAIEQDRRLLDDPDPVAPLCQDLASALRLKLQGLRNELVDAQDQGLQKLSASPEWQQLDERAQQDILRANGIGPIGELMVGNDEALLRTLDAMPLGSWQDRLAALPPRLAAALADAVQRLKPAAVKFKPPTATLANLDDLDHYIEELKASIVEHLRQDHPVVII